MISNTRWLIITSIGLLTLMSCKSDKDKGAITQEILADMICECSAPIVRHNQILSSLMQSSGTKGQIEAQIQKGEGIFEEASKCITNPINRDISAILTPVLWEKVKVNCQLDERITADLILRIDEFNQSQEW